MKKNFYDASFFRAIRKWIIFLGILIVISNVTFDMNMFFNFLKKGKININNKARSNSNN